MTQTKNASSAQTNEEGTLKTEIKQYLRECGVDFPGDMYNQDNYNQRFQNNRTGYEYNGNRNYIHGHRYDYGNNEYSNGYQGNDNKNIGSSGAYYDGNPGNTAENCNDNKNDRYQANYGNPYPYTYGQFGPNNNNENIMYNNMNRHSAHYESYPNRNGVQHDNCNYDNRDVSGYGTSNRNGFNVNNGNRGTYDQNYGTRTPTVGGGYGSYGNSNNRYRNGLHDEKRDELADKSNLALKNSRTRRSSDAAQVRRDKLFNTFF